MSTTKNMPLNWYSSMKKNKNEKDSDNFWHRKLTLKVKDCLFLSLDLTKYFLLWESAIFHSIKLPFDAQVVQKILNVIYSAGSPQKYQFGTELHIDTFRYRILTDRYSKLWFLFGLGSIVISI